MYKVRNFHAFLHCFCEGTEQIPFFKKILDKSNKKCGEALEIYTFQEVTHMKFSEEVKTTLWSMIDQMSTNLS